MIQARAISLVLFAGATLPAHDVITTKLTWSREVSRIFLRRCVSCHRPSGVSFPLTTYDESRPWAQAIKEEVLGRRMPPWGAIEGFGEFRNNAGLNQEEIEIISAWVEGGAPKGDDVPLPEPAAITTPTEKILKSSGSLTLSGSLKVSREAVIMAIRPLKLPQGASVRVVATRPDGAQEPLIWLYNYTPASPRTYYLRTPLRLPPGSLIQMSPPDAGAISLLLLQH